MATAEPNLVGSEPTTKNNIQKVINNGTEYLIYGGGEGIKVFDVPAIGADITEQIDILTKGGAVMYRLNNHGAEDWHFNVVAFVKDARYIEIRSDMVSLFDESDTSAGYKDVGYIIYIYYNTSGVVNNVVTRYAGGLPTGGTAGQVLTKTETGTAWGDVSGGGVYQVDLLLVGGGGAGGGVGGPGTSYSGSCNSCGGGGGGGAVVFKEGKLVNEGTYNVVVGKGGDIDSSYLDNGWNGGTSRFGMEFAPGGGGGLGYYGSQRCIERINGHATHGGAYQRAGCSWCGGEAGYNDKYALNKSGRTSTDGDYARSKAFESDTAGNVSQKLFVGQCSITVGCGGIGCSYGGCTPSTSSGYGGGGSGGWHCCNNSNCYTLPGKGGDGVVMVNYYQDTGLYAEGGIKNIEEDGNVYHTFTEDGVFIVKKPNHLINAILVGGGGGGIYLNCKTGAGGGGGEVIYTQKDLNLNSPVSISVGKGGTGCYTSVAPNKCAGDGGDTTMGDIVVRGGKGATTMSDCRPYGGTSGNGNVGYYSGNISDYGGAGGGAGGCAPQCYQSITYGEYVVGDRKRGYGYGGNGAGCCSASRGTICQCLQAGSGGSGVNYQSGRDGLVKIWYKIGDGINTSSGGDNCCVENGCCFHEFTNDGTFTALS